VVIIKKNANQREFSKNKGDTQSCFHGLSAGDIT